MLENAIKNWLIKELELAENNLETLKSNRPIFPKYRYNELLNESLGYIDGINKAIKIVNMEMARYDYYG
jgi:hypothetical protein